MLTTLALFAWISGLAACGIVEADGVVQSGTDARAGGGDDTEAFYQLPESITPADPGTIIRSEPVPAPEGMQAWRVLYHSRTPQDEDIAVSGVIMAPVDPASGSDAGGAASRSVRRVVTFGHGTTGINDACAPSRSDPPFAGLGGTLDLVKAGYVVAATDYPGLGTPGDHPIYVAGYAGRAVLDAARAAHRLQATGAGTDVVIWGYSQGGQAALAAGGLAATYAPDLHVRGVAATAPLADLPASLHHLQRNKDGVAYLLLAATGLAAAEPGVDLKAILTPTGRRLALIADRNCAIALTTASYGETIATVFSEDPLVAEPFASGFARQRDAVLGRMAPILIMQGDLDQVIDQPTTDGVVTRLCAARDVVDYRRYAIADHGTILTASFGHLTAWVNERFEDRPGWDICRGRLVGGV